MILPGTGRGTAPEGRGGGGSSLRRPEVYAARKLRRSMSPPEAMLWQELRGARLGFKVRRQHPIGPYVADFFVRDGRLVVEIDGSAHDLGDRPHRDEVRDRYMLERGYRIVRIAAGDVTKDIEAVLRFIAVQAGSPLHHPSDGPPPHAGEEF